MESTYYFRAPENYVKKTKAKLLHWTLGGPWFKDQRNMGGDFAIEWFKSRDEAMRLWE